MPIKCSESYGRCQNQLKKDAELVIENVIQNLDEGLRSSRDDSYQFSSFSTQVIRKGKTLHVMVHLVSNFDLCIGSHSLERYVAKRAKNTNRKPNNAVNPNERNGFFWSWTLLLCRCQILLADDGINDGHKYKRINGIC